MISPQTRSVIDRATRIYDDRLRHKMEPEHSGRFVAVEPESGEYFLADSFDDAVTAARIAYPTRLSHVLRVGYAAAFHVGAAWS